MNKPVVSVLMITYNHEKYISEAIEGVLMQKTTFPIELIIGEDCSTDSTRKIVVEYAEKHPDIIRPLLPESNLGMMKNFIKTMEAAKGKYIALCEGDDYWTDPYKLQKQVDFLDANEDYSICSHRYSFYSERTEKFANDTYDNIVFDVNGNYYFDQYSYFTNWLTQTLTVIFRKDSLGYDIFEQFERKIDFTLFYSIIRSSKGCLMNFSGGVYRLHENGISTALGNLNHAKWHYEIGIDLYKIENNIFTLNVAKANLIQYMYSYIKLVDRVDYKFIKHLFSEYISFTVSIKEVLSILPKLLKASLLRLIKHNYYKNILKRNY